MSRFTRREVLGLLGATMGASLGAGLPALARAQQQGPIRIGVLLPMSGPGAIEGHQVLKGVELAVAQANEQGVLGRKIEIVLEDDESNSTKGVIAVRKMIEREKVPFIVGTYPTAVAIAASKVAREYKVPMLSGGSTGAAATEANTVGDPWFFRAWPDSNGQGADTARAIVHQFGAKRVSIIHDNTNYGTTLAQQAKEVITKEGGQIISTDSYNTGEQDFATMLTRLRTQKPDAVYIAGWAGDGASIVRQAANVGLRTQFVGSGSMLSDDFIKLAGPASEGFAVATLYESTTPNDAGRVFGDQFRAIHKYEAGTLNALGYDSTRIGIEAMRRVGKPDSLAIQQMLRSGMKDFPIVQGPKGATAAFDDRGSIEFPMFIAIVKNGKRTLS